MSVKRNFVFNSLILVSQYLMPLIIFPYISRIFGVEKIGLVNFVDNIINYFILLSTLGLTITGVREISKNKEDQNNLNKIFSELFIIHIILTLIFLIIYLVIIFSFDKFKENQILYLIGASKLIFNIFLIEWLYRGLENFKYITIRSILIKVLYSISIFLLVKSPTDINIYFGLTCGILILNAISNFTYSTKLIKLKIKNLELKQHLKSIITLGSYIIITSLYTTFNITYLGLVTNNNSVGAYTTSLKIYTIILGIFTALNEVLIPKLSKLAIENSLAKFEQLIEKSVNFISTLSFPIIFSGILLTPQIIRIITGPGYEGSIICLRILLPLLFIIGFAQILSNQILISFKKDKELLITASIGALVGVSFNLIFVSDLKEAGTALVLLVSESIVTLILLVFCLKRTKIRIPLKLISKHLILAVPYLPICFIIKENINNDYLALLISAFFCIIYFTISQSLYLKNELLIENYNRYFKIPLKTGVKMKPKINA
ncbi:oligosaccharide flippase family protein [Adhaeribacter terreus]|uniref:Oligosaccharide flippase family protein n=1 Tax=Adhaeribacter terreus TaxID=529703 RepID=A0ABW0EFC0_9BACT